MIQVPGDNGVSTPVVAAGPHGLVCAIYDGTPVPGTDPDEDYRVKVVCSADGGQTFGAPVMLGRDTASLGLPAGVAPDGGPTIAAARHGQAVYAAFTTHQPGADHSGIVVLFTSWPRPLRFGPPLTVTSRPFDPAEGTLSGGKHGAWWIGDYQGLASVPGALHPFWNDTRTGRLELFTATVRP